jgi:hypothetical protein
MSRAIAARAAAGAAALLTTCCLALLLSMLGTARAEEGRDKCDADDRGSGAGAAALPPNNIVACFGAATTDALADCASGGAGSGAGGGKTGGTIVPLLSASVGVTNSASTGSSGGGAGAGKPEFAAFSFTKHVDAASTVLFTDLVDGRHFSTVSVSYYDATGKVVMWQQFSTVFMTALSYSDAVAPGGALIENGSFAYTAIKIGL